MQTKRQSLIETILNVFSGMVIGFSISQLAHVLAPYIQQYIWSGFVWKLSAGSNAVMTVVLTAVSVMRSYCWRRYFNHKHAKMHATEQEVKRAGVHALEKYQGALTELKGR